jgi:5-methylcytosine-specific restriction enzyme A
MPITPEQIAAAYKKASEVFDGRLRPEAAANFLHSEHALNKSSARDFIGQYRSLINGTVFKRTMSALAMEYFLSQILQQRGKRAAESAVSAAWKHVDYYEGIQHTTLHRIRAVLQSFEPLVSALPSLQAIEAQFVQAVTQSLTDAAAARRKRLQSSTKIPATVIATATVYVRNPDVVAEVLSRAEGRCELCGSSAPFVRKTDRSPYLEVHHKVQLSKGGHDSVENAIAICPNCHRQEHFG